MKIDTQLLGLKIKVSSKAIVWVLSQWRYALLAVIIAFLFFEIVYWMFNPNLVGIVLFSNNLTVIEKINFFVSPLGSIASMNGIVTAILMGLLAVVQGIALATLVYTIRHQRKIDAKAIGGGTFVGLLAVIGLGCPACGTSLVAPVVALFASGSAAAVSESITNIALPIALLVGIYALYAVGLKAAGARAESAQNATVIDKTEPRIES